MATFDKYLVKLRAMRTQHAYETVNSPAEVTERNYAVACGFQKGLARAEKLVQEVLDEDEKDMKKL